MLQTSEIMTIVICVIKEEMPSFSAFENTLKSGTKLALVSLNVLVRKKYAKQITNETS